MTVCSTTGLVLIVAQVALIQVALVQATHEESNPTRDKPDERNATIAFHVTVDDAQLPNLHRLFDRIYHPENIYLIDYHPHIPSSSYLTHVVNYPNVHQRHADLSVPDGVSHVLNILDGIAHFLNREDFLSREIARGTATRFDYFIPLTPESYPTIPAANLRAMLPIATSHDKPPNFFHFAHPSQLHFHEEEIDRHVQDTTLAFNASLVPSLQTSRKVHPDVHRRKFALPRASPHFVINRHFAKLATDSALAKRLLFVLAETSFVSLRFFAALASAADPRVVGPVHKAASLHCVDSNALSESVLEKIPSQEVRAPSVKFLLQCQTPCFFTAPLARAQSLHVRDDIDMQLLIPPGVQGKPSGIAFHELVHDKLKPLLSTQP